MANLNYTIAEINQRLADVSNKENSANKNMPNGYAGLEASGMLAPAVLPHYSSLAAVPAAATFGVGECLVVAANYTLRRVSDGTTWKAVTGFFNTVADFTALTAAAYGVGPFWSAGRQYWCDGTGYVEVAPKPNLPELALSNFRKIPNGTVRKIAWLGDSTTQQKFNTAISSYYAALGQGIPNDAALTDRITITDIAGDNTAGYTATSVAHNWSENTYFRISANANGLVTNTVYIARSVTANTFMLHDVNGVKLTGLTTGTGLTISASPGSYAYGIGHYPEGPFWKVQHKNFGESGQTLMAFLAGTAAYTLADIVAFAPDMIVLRYGINDVRLGLTSESQLTARLDTFVQQVTAVLPNVCIILNMPNSILYDAANASGYIDAPVSLSKVQGYSDILRNSYLNMVGRYPNTLVLDTQSGKHQIFSKTSTTLANKGTFMSDVLHPTGEGYAAEVRAIARLLGDFGDLDGGFVNKGCVPFIPTTFSKQQSRQATAISSANDYLYYPRVCEDTDKYNLIFEGSVVSAVPGGNLQIATLSGTPSGNYVAATAQNDIIVQYGVKDTAAGSQGETTKDGVTAWKLTTRNAAEVGGNLYLTTSAMAGYPRTSGLYNKVRIFRPRPATQKNAYDPNITIVMSAADFTAATLSHTVQRAGPIGVMAAVSATGPSTGGTIDIKKNGIVVATLTFTALQTSATGTGTFFTVNTKGIWFDEGDLVQAVINAGFVGGTFPKITLSNS